MNSNKTHSLCTNKSLTIAWTANFFFMLILLLTSCGKTQKTASILTEEKIVQEQGTQALLIGHYISTPLQIETTGDLQEQVFSQEVWSATLRTQQEFDAILKLANCASLKGEQLDQVIKATAQLAGYFRESDHLLIAKVTLNLSQGSTLECHTELSRGSIDQVNDTYLQLLSSGLSLRVEEEMNTELQVKGNKSIYFLR